MERHKTSHLAMMNNNDAFLVIWSTTGQIMDSLFEGEDMILIYCT